MRRHAVLTILAILAMLTSGFTAPQTGTGLVDLGDSDRPGGEPETYIVLLSDPPLAAYEGGIPGLEPTAAYVRGDARLDADSAAAAAYRSYLGAQQDAFLALAEVALGRSVAPSFRYDAVLNGLAVELRPDEVAVVATLPQVAHVEQEDVLDLLTDAGPEWIGADEIWSGDASPGGSEITGEGVVVGVIDTGVNPDHPSFAAVGPIDGHEHENPHGRYFGLCDPVTGAPYCNDKLIGMWDFTDGDPTDWNAHGSHVAGTVAGNVVQAELDAPTTSISATIAGVAPHANIISYRGCSWVGCLSSSILASINQAALDGVDVVNFSIGGGAANPWFDSMALAFLNARAAGVFVATSAGNSGPGQETVGRPANAPWVTTVGASTHDRLLRNSLVDITGGDDALRPPDIHGKGLTSGYGPAPIVYAGDIGDGLCLEPFPAGTWQDGEIVVCDRGEIARVEKADNVAAGGAAGLVLANEAASGDSIVADAYSIPGVGITYDDGVALKEWLAVGEGHRASITGMVEDRDAAHGDVMAGFSSRGANRPAPDIIKPDVTAPGVDILAAFNAVGGETERYGIISGTSMSSPHVAGAAALVRAAHPDWTPDEIRSALMTTAFHRLPGTGGEVHDPLKEDSATLADPFDLGAGRVDLRTAALAGLVMDESPQGYRDANPRIGGDPRELNLPSLGDHDCAETCAWTRTVRSVADETVTWTAATEMPDGMTVTVEPAAFTLDPGQEQTVSVTVQREQDPALDWQFGSVTLSPDVDLPDVRLPVAVGIPGDDRLTLHFRGNLDDGCTGDGRLDGAACGGPFLRPDGDLSTAPPARFGPVQSPLRLGGDRDPNVPHWVWDLDEPTVLEGSMTAEWWASCAACGEVLAADWTVRLWADGALVFEELVRATPNLPDVPSLVFATVDLPRISADETFVLQIVPVFINQAEGFIYYDSTGDCPGAVEPGPCDSVVHVPVVDVPPDEPDEPGPDERPVLHFRGNLEDGCTGQGNLDGDACDGPFLLEDDELSGDVAARWLTSALVGDEGARNDIDPNWVWRLDDPLELEGTMDLTWWGACSACSAILEENFIIRLFADGDEVFEGEVAATALLPGVATRFEAQVDLPRIEAAEEVVLQIRPVWIDTQTVTAIYYDSQAPCPGASGTDPCDSFVAMPVVADDELPDLVVPSITARNADDPRPGSERQGPPARLVEITAIIANIGDGDAGASTTAIHVTGPDASERFDVETTPLAAGDETDVSAVWDATGKHGTYAVTVTADVDGDVDEVDEANNTSTLSVTVRNGRVTRTSFEPGGSTTATSYWGGYVQ